MRAGGRKRGDACRGRPTRAPVLRQASSTPTSGGALVVADLDGEDLAPSTLAAVAAATLLGSGPVTVLVAGAATAKAAAQAASAPGVDAVLTATHPTLAHALAEPAAALAAAVVDARGFAAALAPATTAGRNLLPRVAALACRDMVSDVTGVETGEDGGVVFTRGAYAGAVTEVVAYTDGGPRFLTVRPASFPALKEGGSAGVAPVEVEAGELEAATVGLEGREGRDRRRAALSHPALLFSLPLPARPGFPIPPRPLPAPTWARPRRSSQVAALSATLRRSPRSAPWPTAWAARWARRGPRWMAAWRPTSCRWGRRGGSSRPPCTSLSAFPARPSTWPA